MPPGKDFDFKRLEQRATEATAQGKAQIPGGKPGEEPVGAWRGGGVNVTRMPDDEQGILRISIGGCTPHVAADYCVFRGDPRACADMLKRAWTVMEEILKGL